MLCGDGTAEASQAPPVSRHQGHAQAVGGAAAHSDDDLVGLRAHGDRFGAPHPRHGMLQRHQPEFQHGAWCSTTLLRTELACVWLHCG